MKFVFALCSVLYVLGVATLLLTPTEVKTSVKPRVNKHIVHAPPIALFGPKCKFQHTKKLVTTTSLNDMTALLSLLLKRTVKILDSLKIKYTIGHGTLLGYERSGTFLPWDDDLDIRIYPPHWIRLASLYLNSTLVNKEFYVHGIRADARLNKLDKIKDIQFSLPSNNHIKIIDTVHIDIVTAKSYRKNFWKSYEFVFNKPLVQVILHGVKVTKPAHAYIDRTLRLTYGTDWRTPRPRSECKLIYNM